MAPAPRISVVVATRDRRERLGGAARLAARADARTPTAFEVIVVDDGSADGTRRWLAEQAEAQRYAARADRRAARPAVRPRARNDGWRRGAGASLVAFTDDDCEATPDWLERLLERRGRASRARSSRAARAPNPRELDRAGPFSVTREVDGSGPLVVRDLQHRLPARAARAARAASTRPSPSRSARTPTSAGGRWRPAPGAAFARRRRGRPRGRGPGPRRSPARRARSGADGVLVFQRHPLLRASALDRGMIRNHAHLRLLLAVVGLLGARRFAPLALLALPYAAAARPARPRRRGDPLIGPYFVAYDAAHAADHRARRPAPPRAGALTGSQSARRARRPRADPAPPLASRPDAVERA